MQTNLYFVPSIFELVPFRGITDKLSFWNCLCRLHSVHCSSGTILHFCGDIDWRLSLLSSIPNATSNATAAAILSSQPTAISCIWWIW